ncbi:hypothetical protein EDB81DRAFT_656172 [Dactylonectria macrodidyma]|uniref:Uncharacterized protein n=1 Tax=Dactylonectria macrodidyma TaxID=307937 RepID=A0A9P9J0M9_9HYPO|nr:hypothetical protein EDB81DRAFT_656172 [Dactylonectria macrodidyma]
MSFSAYLTQVSLMALLVSSGFHLKTAAAQDVCTTQDQPNPIFSQYPSNATGALNTTLAITPIPMALARQIIPQQYAILEHAYRALMPDFPADMYPALVQAGHDHDIRFQNIGIPDFSRAGFEFPFLDILGDGSSSFRWAPEQMISAANLAAIQGSEAYGTEVYPSTFNPPCDAYAMHPDGRTYFNATAGGTFMSLQMKRANANEPFHYPISLFENITNQPSFANGSTCDQQIRLFNTSLTQVPFQPVPVRGTVKSNVGPFRCGMTFSNVAGFQVSTAFIENNYLPCEMFRGYKLPTTT